MTEHEKAFWAFVERENRRVRHEWDQWDGTHEHAMQINDRQCARLLAERQRLGLKAE